MACSKIRITIRITHTGQETPVDNQRGESDGKRPARSAAASGRLFLQRHRLGDYRSWDLLGEPVQPRSPTQAAAKGIELLSEVVT